MLGDMDKKNHILVFFISMVIKDKTVYRMKIDKYVVVSQSHV